MVCQPVFEPDDEYDRICASDGLSRYGAYLDRYRAWFAGPDGPTADAERFAAAAWRVAVPPVMSPGYVRVRGPAWDAQIHLDDDRRPTVLVDIEAPCTSQGRRGRSRHWRGSDGSFTVVRIAVPLAGAPLPDPRYQAGRPDTGTAKVAVRVICALINAITRSVVTLDAPVRSLR